MVNDTTADSTGGADATLLLDLDGLAVAAVTRTGDGSRVALLTTVEECAAACPSCGVFACRVKEYVCTRPRDLPCGGQRLQLVWRKRRWYCGEERCARASFTESVPALPARCRITTRLRAWAGDLVVDGVSATVKAAARAAGLSWATTMDAVRVQADAVLSDEPDPVEVLGIDEVRRGRHRSRSAPPAPEPPQPSQPVVPQPDPPPACDSATDDASPPGPDDQPTGNAVDREPRADRQPEPQEPEPQEPEPQEPEPQEPGAAFYVAPVAGETAKARVLADRWHVGFTDIGGGQGMLAQVEGRTGDDVAYWLAMQRPAWRDRVRYVAIDMCTVFVSAIRRYLPHATIVVDHFHVVQLANDTVAEVRRQQATLLRGRRGRAKDPEYQVRNLLRRNREDLSGKAFAKLWNTLVDLGAPGLAILKTWIAKEQLRRLLALAGTRPGRSVISQRLYRFYTWCADAGVPELERLATTIDTWWPAIEAFLHTKITNAKSEGYNRVVKLDARNAFGYRNPANQRLRTRCATTRRARGCLDPG